MITFAYMLIGLSLGMLVSMFFAFWFFVECKDVVKIKSTVFWGAVFGAILGMMVK